FINEIASICEALGADVKEVARGMGLDKRIGLTYLEAGIGWGGSCLPKDVRALHYMASIHGCHPQLLRAVMDINRDQRIRVVQKLRNILGTLEDKLIGLLGLSFKPNTDDMREAPSIEIVHLLQNERARVKAYDPAAMENAKRILKDVTYCSSAYEVAEGSDALIVVTEWNEFRQLDMARIKGAMRQPVLIDGRNIYDPQKMREMGFIYRGIGRG
ncbi:MAG TPA: UDP-glucose/GDP-mannose dehydrogenase family protein, partial [Anaerolineae bacterium]|nr:UDP-glucose/GDP-mannose dehydrogenase family protein [Anaerolineae bacterium]